MVSNCQGLNVKVDEVRQRGKRRGGRRDMGGDGRRRPGRRHSEKLQSDFRGELLARTTLSRIFARRQETSSIKMGAAEALFEVAMMPFDVRSGAERGKKFHHIS